MAWTEHHNEMLKEWFTLMIATTPETPERAMRIHELTQVLSCASGNDHDMECMLAGAYNVPAVDDTWPVPIPPYT